VVPSTLVPRELSEGGEILPAGVDALITAHVFGDEINRTLHGRKPHIIDHDETTDVHQLVGKAEVDYRVVE
jgi:hypothetical protein